MKIQCSLYKLSRRINFSIRLHLHTSDFVENSVLRIHSGLIQANVPAVDVFDDCSCFLARPKSVIFNVLCKRSLSLCTLFTCSKIRTKKKGKTQQKLEK